MYKVGESLAFVCGVPAPEVGLDEHGEPTVARGAEPNLADGLTECAEVLLAQLLENHGDDFGNVHFPDRDFDFE